MTQPTNVRLITEDRYTADMAGKADDAHTHPWTDVSDKPTTYPPAAHSHVVGDVTGLQGALDGKADDAHTHTKADVGLGNVDNTSDAAKPVSTATQTALDGKEPSAWTGTQAAYNALGTKDANRTYYITG